MMRKILIALALLAPLSAAHAQSQGDLSSKINAALPDNGRGQITAAGLRGVFNAFNASRGVANGFATLDATGRLTPAQLPTVPLATVKLLGSVPPIDTTVETTPNPNAIIFGIGNSVSYCPFLSCLQNPTAGHQRTSALFSAQTQDDGHSQEQTVGVATTVQSGYAPAWQPSRAYSVGDNVTFEGNGRNEVYRATQGGVSASSGGPTGTGTGIADGSVVWDWINAAAINGKVGIYNEVVTQAKAGHSWAQANNYEMRAGTIPTFNINTELDFTNHSGIDCELGVANCYNLYLRNYSTNKITSQINVEGPDAGDKGNAFFGMWLHGRLLSSDATIQIDSSGLSGIRIGGFTGAGYAQAGIVEKSTSPRGILLDGTYAQAQISGTGWQVTPDGGAEFKNLGVNGQLYVKQPFVPPTANTSCTKGQQAWDANFIYQCIADNSWKRAAISAW